MADLDSIIQRYKPGQPLPAAQGVGNPVAPVDSTSTNTPAVNPALVAEAQEAGVTPEEMAEREARANQVIQQMQIGSQVGSGNSVNTPASTQIPLSRPPEGVERYARPGVPLNVTMGAPMTQRLGAAFRFSDERKLSYLQNAFNGSKVDQAGEGQFIIRNVADDKGGVQDLLFDETQTSGKDILDLAEAAPQLIAEVAVHRGLRVAQAATGALPWLGQVARRVANRLDRSGRFTRVAMESAIDAGASQTASSLVDAGMQLYDSRSIRVGEIAGHRLGEFGQDFTLGTVLGTAIETPAGLADTARGRLTGTLTPGATEREGIAALDRVNTATGIDIRPTLGQMAHDPNIMKLEAFISRIPFIGSGFRRMMESQDERVRALQRHLMGGVDDTAPAELGGELTRTIRAAAARPQREVGDLKTSLNNRAAHEIESAIEGIAPSNVPLHAPVVTDVVKTAATARHEQFRAINDELYGAAGNPSLPTTSLNSYLDRVEATLPRQRPPEPDETLESIAGDIEQEVQDEIGNMAGGPLADEAARPLNRDLIPPSLTRLLRGLRGLEDEVPLDQLRFTRNTLDNAIREGRGLEDLSIKTLKDLSHALTRTIEEGIEHLPPDVGDALRRANAFYRQNIDQFETPLVARLLKRENSAPGFIDGYEFMGLMGNPDRLMDMERFLRGSLREGAEVVGENAAPVFDLMRKGMLEDIYRRTSSTASGRGRVVDVKAFEREMKTLSADHPEIASLIMGRTEGPIKRNLKLLEDVKEGFEDVDINDLTTFLNRPNNSVQDLSRLVTAKRREREIFDNEVVQKFLNGKGKIDLTANSNQADQAVDWLMKTGNSSDVAHFMALIGDNPGVQARLRANVIADFFQKVKRGTQAADAAVTDSTHLVNPAKLIEELNDGNTARRLRLIMGNDNFEVLRNFATAQAVLGKKTGQTLAGTNAAMAILTNVSKLLTNLPDTAKFTLYSAIFTNPSLQDFIRRGSLNPATDVRALTTLLVGSPPVLNALGDEYGQSGAQLIIDAVKSAVGGGNKDQQQQQQPAQQPAPP